MSRYPEFTRILNQQLLAHERTATWLAQRLRLHPGTVNRWLNQNLRPATPDLVVKIADLLAMHNPKERQTFLLAAGYGYLESDAPSVPVPAVNPTSLLAATQTNQPLHNLPVQSTPFVGRTQELVQLTTQLAQPDLRLLTIVGFGGMGKTRLAVELATQQLHQFADGVWFVSLVGVAPETNSQLNPLVMNLANVLSVVFLGQGDPEEHLLRYLHKKEMLLLFDNMEHLLDFSDFLSRMVLKTGRIKVIVTTRERLKLREEWLFPLDGLTMPPLNHVLPSAQMEAWTSYEAVRLFEQQARRIHPTFDLAAEIDQVFRVCYLLEGMPLGIELAAAWLRQLPLSMIRAEIEKSLDFPSSPLRNQPERHRSFRAVFEQSWQLLTDEEQQVLMGLAVFRDGFQPREAEKVTGASVLVLANLVDKSFLHLTEKGRYEIHERIRQYAEEKLHQQPAYETVVREQHGRTYLAFLDEQCQRLMTAEQQQVLTVLTDDLNNILTAWTWALEGGKLIEIVFAMPSQQGQMSFLFFYFLKSWFLAGIALANRTIVAGKILCGVDTSPQENYQNRFFLGSQLVYLGLLQAWSGALDEAKLNLQEGRALLQTLDPPPLWALAFAENITVVSFHRNLDGKIAIQRLTTSLARFAQLDDTVGQGNTLIALGQAAFSLGNYEQAESFCRSSLIYIKAPSDLGYAYMTLGRIFQEKGKVQQAETYYQEALHAWSQINYQQGLCFLYKDLAHIARLREEYHKAQPYFEQSLELAQRISFRIGELEALLGLALMAEGTGNDGTAEQYFRRMTTIDRELTSLSASALNGLGRIALRSGTQEAAVADFTQSLRISNKAQMAPQALEAIAGIAAYFIQIGHTLRANHLLSFVYHHPATGHETKQWAISLLGDTASEIAPNRISANREYHRSMNLESITVELLRELTSTER